MPDALSHLFIFGPAVWGPAALAGACAGVAGALFIRAYIRLFRLGAHPDARLCVLALKVAFCRPLAQYRKRRSVKKMPRTHAAATTAIAANATTTAMAATVAKRKPCMLGPVWVLALGFGLLAARYGLSPRLLGLAIGTVLLVGAAWLDSRIGLLPNALTYPFLWIGLALSWAGVTVSLYVAVGGVFAGYLFLSLCAGAFRLMGRTDVLGGGDIKLLAGLGAWVGPNGLFLTLLLACVVSIVWAMLGQRTLRPKGHYPFGPFLVFGALCVLCLAPVA